MNKEILTFCTEKGILLDKEISDIFINIDDVNLLKNFLERIIFKYKQKIITKSFFLNNLDKSFEILNDYKSFDKEVIEKFFNKIGLNVENVEEEKIIKKNDVSYEESINLLKIYQNTPKKLEVKDFVKNFKNRYNTIKSFLQERAELENLVSINRIETGKPASIIGLVSDKRVTKNGNVLLEVEDLTGRVTALINKNREDIFEKSKEILLDEVVGLKCSKSGEIVFVNDLIFPDIKVFEKKYSKNDEFVAFTSDLHIGSSNFLEKNFLKFIKWLNGEVGSEVQKKEALKVKYLFIVGDSIDGVGIFPGQENELLIKDINKQYEKLSSLLSKIREDVHIVICPGQHDAVRVAEPQPIIPENYAEQLYFLKNVNLVTNPSYVEIGKDVKFKVLMYHGASMHGIINSIDALRTGKGHDSPTDVVKFMLKKRHLAPSHSLTTYTPLEDEDALLIKDVPDIVLTGDLHRSEIANYNSILLVASSCWQARTPFEEKVGNHPLPCRVPLLSLKTRDIKILDFSEGLDEDGNPLEGWDKYRESIKNGN